MVILPTSENFGISSGLFDVGVLEAVYDTFMDEAFLKLARPVMLHLKPSVQQDTATQSGPASQQYNPFFGRSAVPSPTTRNEGVRVTPNDVLYHGQIVQGPQAENAMLGIGRLMSNQVKVTLAKEAMNDVNNMLSFTIEGRRYSQNTSRIIGFSRPRYIIIIGDEINEQNAPDDGQVLSR